jgi:hypothetical protein
MMRTQQMGLSSAHPTNNVRCNGLLFLLGHSTSSCGHFFRIESCSNSKHSVAVQRDLGDGLDNIPVFDDLAVINSEDVDDGVTVFAEEASVVAVKKNEVSFGENALNFAVCVWVISGNPFDIVAEAVEAVGGKRLCCV